MASGISKGWRTNLVLAVVLLAAAGGLWILDAREASRDEADRKSRALGTIRTEAVVSAEFADDSGKTLTLTKKEGQWQITAPAPARTSGATVKTMLEVLNKPYEQKVAEVIKEAAPYGLHTPAARLTVQDQQGQTVRLAVGATTPTGKKRYVSLGESGPVVLMPESDVAGVVQKNDALRDKNLATVQPHDITRLAIRSTTGGELLLTRDQENHWRLERPFADLANANRIRTWMFALANAQGTAFTSQRPAGDAEWTLEMTPASGNAETLSLWRASPNLLAARPGEPDLMVLPQYLTEEFDKNPMDLVAIRPLEEKRDIDTLGLEQNDQTRSADQKERKWPRSEWNDLVEILQQDAYRGAPLQSQSAPWIKITVGKGEQAVVFPIHKDDKTVFISPPGRPVSLELTPLQSETLQKAVTALMAPKPD
ncbi:MAG: DUF4340 domain-containing protein [Magnetococcales bacterium]|nr:DUF4340 domain-containing protein [Magnetococcales bacterium]